MTRTAIVAVAILACSHEARAGREARGFFVAPGAVDVVEESSKGRASLLYYVREPHPAQATIEFICRSLADHNWQPVTGKAVDEYETSSLDSGWTALPDEAGRPVAHIWSARWLDPKGNQVIYTLGYSAPLAKHGLKPVYLLVSAWYYDKTSAQLYKAYVRELMERIKRSVRP